MTAIRKRSAAALPLISVLVASSELVWFQRRRQAMKDDDNNKNGDDDDDSNYRRNAMESLEREQEPDWTTVKRDDAERTTETNQDRPDLMANPTKADVIELSQNQILGQDFDFRICEYKTHVTWSIRIAVVHPKQFRIANQSIRRTFVSWMRDSSCTLFPRGGISTVTCRSSLSSVINRTFDRSVHRPLLCSRGLRCFRRPPRRRGLSPCCASSSSLLSSSSSALCDRILPCFSLYEGLLLATCKPIDLCVLSYPVQVCPSAAAFFPFQPLSTLRRTAPAAFLGRLGLLSLVRTLGIPLFTTDC